MKYRVQLTWKDNDWHTVGSRSINKCKLQEYDDLETAIRVFLNNTEMARLAPAHQRVIDSDAKIIKYYDPDIWAKGLGDGISSPTEGEI